jgi:acyl-CoA synthetase (AMP-forming)/AMP-acid ligase II
MSTPRSVPTASSTTTSSATLPEHLARWGAERGRAVALRHKEHGVWVTSTWGDVQAEVARVAGALADRGFERGDVVAVASALSPQALAVTLAAQGLGGAALWVEPEALGERDAEASASDDAVSPSARAARFGFARDEAALIALRARFGAARWALALFTAEHVSPHEEGDDATSAVRAYADAAADVDVAAAPRPARLPANPDDSAFLFVGGAAGGVATGADGRPVAPSLTQAASIAGARAWLEAEAVGAGGTAFAWEGPTTAAAAIFLAGWLVAGFTLSLPEDATTADADRREVQPTIVAATGTAYERLQQQVADNLPRPGGLIRRAVDAGLASTAGGVRGALGSWLVRRPLREVLGLRRVAVALELGASAPAAAQELLARLGVPLRALPVAATAEPGAAEAPFSRSAPDHSIRFEPALALSSSTPGKLT